MSQKLNFFSHKDGKAKGVIISKNSVGTIVINGTEHSYNTDKIDDVVIEKDKSKKKKIIIKRK